MSTQSYRNLPSREEYERLYDEVFRVIPPEVVARIGNGDLKRGRMLISPAFLERTSQESAETADSLPVTRALSQMRNASRMCMVDKGMP
jgi:hypothetical protein